MRFPACSLALPALMLFGLGCGRGSEAPTDNGSASMNTAEAAPLPVTQVSNPEKTAEQQPVTKEEQIKKYLLEIKAIRLRSYPKDLDLEAARKMRRERDLSIVKVANKAIGLSYQDEKLVGAFGVAVEQLMEARLQLALQGQKEDVDALYGDAESLFRSFPKSAAAAHANFALARFAHTNAQRYAKDHPEWLTEFAKQSRLFATNFPNRLVQAAPLLAAAGWSCESHGLMEDAKACYITLRDVYPQTAQGRQAAATLRRLELVGKPPQLAGPTIDGGFVSLDQYRGKVVIVAFWSSETAESKKEIPILANVANKLADRGVRVIGVNLDQEEPDVDRFLEQHPLTWPQMFHSDPKQRRWQHPIVTHYGIRKIPAYWVIDRSGKVVSTELPLSKLNTAVQTALRSK